MSTATVSPPAGGAGVELVAVLARLQADAARVGQLVAAGGLVELADAAAASVAVGLAAVAEATRAGSLAGLARVADSGFPQSQGFVTAATWWRVGTRSSHDRASEQVRLARRLARHYPATAAAWSAGQVGGEHGELIASGVDGVLARMARRLRREAAADGVALEPDQLAAKIAGLRAELEGELLALATRWGPETLRVALAHARSVADPDGASAAAMKAAAEASVKLTEVGQMTQVIAYLASEDGAKLRMILDHYRDVRYHTGTTTTGTTTTGTTGTTTTAAAAGGGAETGDDPGGPQRPEPADLDLDPVTGEPVTVTQAQRDAAALSDWIGAALDRGLGHERVSERPHLDITATLDDLVAGTGTAVLDRTGVPTSIHTARRAGCDADVRLVLVDGQYRDPQTGALVEPAVAGLLIAGVGVLDYGRARRIVPARLRRALGVRDRGCAFPGCGRAPAHCQAHHVRHWIDGGPTSLANTVLLCSRHHHYVHEGGWSITPRAGLSYHQPGYWAFAPPPRTRP